MAQQAIDELERLGFRIIQQGGRYMVVQNGGQMMTFKPTDEAGLVELARVIVALPRRTLQQAHQRATQVH